MLYSLIKPLLFSMDPEDAHHLVLKAAELSPILGKLSAPEIDSRLQVKVGSLFWNSPLGLAAGLDKNAQALEFFYYQHFGAIECGTITLHAQEGNPRPRMFRYPQTQSLRNSMGFPNLGVKEILPRLKNFQEPIPIGVNIGKNKNTSPDDSIFELSQLFNLIKNHADYFVINVSSPNTPGLRELQEKNYLSSLFSELNKTRNDKDLYLKISPDLPREKILELIELSHSFKLTGVIATNTTIKPEMGIGGISGGLLKTRAREVREIVLKECKNLEVIGVGGISHSKDLFDWWEKGGKVVQLYTAYVYQGPALLKAIYADLLRFLKYQEMTLLEFFSLPQEERSYRIKNFLS